MFKNYLTGLFNYRVKRTAFIIAPLMFLLDMSTYVIPGSLMNTPSQHILMNYAVILALISIIGSRDKLDDELSRQVRYGVYKQTLNWTLVILCVTTLLLAQFDITEIPTLVICYMLEGILVLHILLYHLGIRYTPRWLLKEEEVPEQRSRAMQRLLIALSIVIGVLYILSFILKE